MQYLRINRHRPMPPLQPANQGLLSSVSDRPECLPHCFWQGGDIRRLLLNAGKKSRTVSAMSRITLTVWRLSRIRMSSSEKAGRGHFRTENFIRAFRTRGGHMYSILLCVPARREKFFMRRILMSEPTGCAVSLRQSGRKSKKRAGRFFSDGP